jgi:hypothetical protein
MYLLPAQNSLNSYINTQIFDGDYVGIVRESAAMITTML